MRPTAGRFVRCGAAFVLRIEQRIGIEIGSESTRASFGDARQRSRRFNSSRSCAVALLRRIEIGEPPSRDPPPRPFRQGGARIDDGLASRR